MIKQFLDWVDGGTEAEANITDNMATAAALFAAVESARTGCGVDVTDMLAVLR